MSYTSLIASERLAAVRAEIQKIFDAGQSYGDGEDSLTRANLRELFAEAKFLETIVAKSSHKRWRVVNRNCAR